MSAALLFLAAFSFAWMPVARAAQAQTQLSYVSDTISDSRPSVSVNHAIVFRTTSGIPASGQIVISFENTPFSIDPLFSYTDMDLAVSTSSSLSDATERTLAAIPDGTDDGVAVSPVTGPITITLSSGSGIPAGSYVRVLLGTNAPAGVYQITNPSAPASYRIFIDTYTAMSAPLDYGAAMVAIIPAVGVDANTNGSVPVLSDGLPSGTIPSNAGNVLVSFDTNIYATCRYATSSGVSYDAMAGVTDDQSSDLFHTFIVGNIVLGNTYTFYARCSDYAGNKNTTDYIISFYAGNPTGTGTGGGAPGSGSSGGGGGGGGAPYAALPPSPSLVISGIAMPDATIAVLQDGSQIPTTASTDSYGNFSVSIPSLPQGTYSFTIEVTDGSPTPISFYTTTITLISGTTNNITGVVLPPSIGFVTSTVALGKPFFVSGLGEPSSTVDILVTSQANGGVPLEATTTADPNGVWSYPLSTVGLPMGTYQVKARSLVQSLAESSFSSPSFLGVGEAAANLKIGDLNGDGKVNLVDFSIMLAHWGTDYAPADLNGDGKVDLPDLSIMLAHWTG